MKGIYIVLSLLSCLTLSCDDEAGITRDKVFINSLTGTWLLEEYGFSPGSGYMTQSVPAIPPQTLSLNGDFTMSSNKEGLVNYRYYRIVQDTVNESDVLAFFEEDPGNGPLSISNLKHSYTVTWEGNMMKLSFRWCIEGCHFGFRKISDEETTE